MKDKKDIGDVLEKIKEAKVHVRDLYEGKGQCALQKPSGESRDSGCIIMSALRESERILLEMDKDEKIITSVSDQSIIFPGIESDRQEIINIEMDKLNKDEKNWTSLDETGQEIYVFKRPLEKFSDMRLLVSFPRDKINTIENLQNSRCKINGIEVVYRFDNVISLLGKRVDL